MKTDCVVKRHAGKTDFPPYRIGEVVKKLLGVMVLTVVLSSFGFAQEAPVTEETSVAEEVSAPEEAPATEEISVVEEAPVTEKVHKYKPLDMMLGLTSGVGFNMKGNPYAFEKDSYFIFEAYLGMNYDFYILYWLSASTGLYVSEVASMNFKTDLSDSNLSISDVLRTPISITLPLSAHVNMPGLEWLYLGAGINFHIPIFSLTDTISSADIDMPDTKGDPYVSLPIDVGFDFSTAGKSSRRLLLRVTPHFFESYTLVAFGIAFQSNMRIYSKK